MCCRKWIVILRRCYIMRKLTTAVIDLEECEQTGVRVCLCGWGDVSSSVVAGGRQEDAPDLPGTSVWNYVMVRTLHATLWSCTAHEICPCQTLCGRGNYIFLVSPKLPGILYHALQSTFRYLGALIILVVYFAARWGGSGWRVGRKTHTRGYRDDVCWGVVLGDVTPCGIIV